jgi:hypothetical protein
MDKRAKGVLLLILLIPPWRLRTGPVIFSRSGETRQDNDLAALRGASVCAGSEAKFQDAWAKS